MTLQNQDAITAFFAGKGLTAAQIAGIEGNLQIESGGNPAAYNPRENAHGIAQWEGGRWTTLQSFAGSTGGSTGDLTTQLNFYWQELQTTERGAMSALLAAATPAQAATAIQSKYERSAPSSLQARIDAAQQIAAGGLQGGNGQVTTGSTGGGGQQFTAAPAGWNPFDFISGGAKQLGAWLVDGYVVVLGSALILVALVLLAKAGGASVPTTSSGGGGSSAPRPRRAVERDAEKAAVAA